MVDELLDFFVPKKCVVCGVEGVVLCGDCKKELVIGIQICPMCGEESSLGWTHEKCRTKWGLDGLIYLYEYEDLLVKKVIDGIKYDFNKDLVGVVFKGLIFELGEKFDFLVPVPLYFYRENWRGFNQAELIAKSINLSTKVGVEVVLVRNKNTKQQALMKTKREREENVKGSFRVRIKGEEFNLRGKNVLLVDDVFTSGANMRECCEVLKRQGVKKVWGFALGH